MKVTVKTKSDYFFFNWPRSQGVRVPACALSTDRFVILLDLGLGFLTLAPGE